MEFKTYSKEEINSEDINEALKDAKEAIGELNEFVKEFPYKEVMINSITLNEAKDSSAIEGIYSYHEKICQGLISEDLVGNATKEIINYRKAILKGFDFVRNSNQISIDEIVDLQAMIEPMKTGIRKIPGTVIANGYTGEIIYTPPQDEKEIRKLLSKLEVYINDDSDGIDPLIKVSNIHFLYESIHPFYDGNGRTGRMLINFYLILNGLLDFPICYISHYINQNRNDYYRLLRKLQSGGNPKEWIIYFLNGFTEMAKHIIHTLTEIQNSMVRFKERLEWKLSDETLCYLFEDICVKCKTTNDNIDILINEGYIIKQDYETESYYINRWFADFLQYY